MFTIDSNIIIAYLGGEEKVVTQIQEWRRYRLALFISSVVECEILSYSKLTPSEETRIEKFIQENCVTLPFDSDLAKRAAAIRRKIPSLKVPDAAIAALALFKRTPLITRNIKDFSKVPSLKIVSL